MLSKTVRSALSLTQISALPSASRFVRSKQTGFQKKHIPKEEWWEYFEDMKATKKVDEQTDRQKELEETMKNLRDPNDQLKVRILQTIESLDIGARERALWLMDLLPPRDPAYYDPHEDRAILFSEKEKDMMQKHPLPRAEDPDLPRRAHEFHMDLKRRVNEQTPDSQDADSTEWHWHAGVIVERPPLMLKEVPDWARPYWVLKEQQRQRRESTIDFQPFFDEVAADKAKNKQTAKASAAASAASNLLTSEEEEEAEAQRQFELREAASKFPRLTEDDKTNNKHSYYRCLDVSLYLVVRNKQTKQWTLPAGNILSNESCRDTAERELRSQLGTDVDVYFLGNAPSTYTRTTYAKPIDGKKGAKTYYMPCLYFSGDVRLSSEYDDYAWVTKTDLPNYLKGEIVDNLNRTLTDWE